LQLTAAFMLTPGGNVGASLLRRGWAVAKNVGGKLLFTGLTEGGEEVYQEMIQKKAIGDERGFAEMLKDPDMGLVFSLGAIAGLGMGAGGDILVRVENRTQNKLNTEQRGQFETSKAEYVAKGLPEDVATHMALENVVEQNPELKQRVIESVKEVEKEIITELMQTEAGREALGGMATRVLQKGAMEQGGLPIDKERQGMIDKFLATPDEEIIRPSAPSVEIIQALEERGFSREYIDTMPIPEMKQALRQPVPRAEGEGELEGLKRTNPMLFNRAQKASNVEEFIDTVVKADKTTIDNVSIPALTDFFNKVKGVTPTPTITEQPIPTTEPGQPEAGYQPSMIEGVTEKEVRPEGKGRISQLSMEEQLKLQQAREEAEEATAEEKEAYEAQEELEGTQATLESHPARDLTSLIKKTGKMKGELSNLTIAQYKKLTGKSTVPKSILTLDGKHVKWEYALDSLATERGYESGEALREGILEAKALMDADKALQAKIKERMTTKPLKTVPRAEKKLPPSPTGETSLSPEQREKVLTLFGLYVNSPNAINAWKLTRELRSKTLAGKAEDLKNRVQELLVTKGVPAEEALNQAIGETLKGELPSERTDYMSDLTADMRNVLFQKVIDVLSNEPLELASTVTALRNALEGKPIPMEAGAKGGSAYTRLQRVFSPEVFKAIEKAAKEKKPIKKMLEGLFKIVGNEPIAVDPEMAEYLRNLPQAPFGQAYLSGDIPTLLKLAKSMTQEEIDAETEDLKLYLAKEPVPPTRPPEPPIDDVLKQMPLFPKPASDRVIRVLKEIGMSPVDIGNFLRANLASFDFSFWRQQAPLIAGNPKDFIQANIEAWNAIWSQKSAEASMIRITQDPLYDIYAVGEDNGGDFLRPLELKKGTAQWRGTEEFGYLTGERLIPRLTSKLPWVKISSRAFVVGTNVHNWLIFKKYYASMLRLNEQYARGEKTLKPGEAFDITKEMVDFAKMLANFSARGSLGKFSAAAPELSGLFFAPRAAVGRILSAKDLLNANPRVRKQAWKNMASFVGVLGGIICLGGAMDWWDVETDPRSAEYMSIRFGNTRIDPWGGFRQYLVFFARAITQTGVSSITGAEYNADPINLMQTAIRGKASPLASLVLDFWRGKNFIGEEVDITNKRQWAERMAPFALQDIYEAWEDDPAIAMVSAIPAIVGAGVQTYTGDWVDDFSKLGLPKYSENLGYGITDPKYDTADFWADHSSSFKGVDPTTLTDSKGFPEYIRSIAEARIIKENLTTMPSDKLININADPSKGTTFAQYYEMYRDREKLVTSGDEEALKEFDADERTRNAYMGNMSQREFALLNEYWAITDEDAQEAFLNEHRDVLATKSRDNYLKEHPEENALLAVWGQSKILTDEAWTEFNKLMETLDIPDSAIPADRLNEPPEGLLDVVPDYFSFSATVQNGIPKEESLWKPYFDYNRLPGSSYLNMTQSQVDAGFLPDKFKAEWETYRKLKTDTAKELYRKGHKEAAYGNRREDFRRKNPEFDQWLQDERGLKPLPDKVSGRGYSTGGIRKPSAPSMGGFSPRPKRAAPSYPSFPKPSISTSLSIRAPRVPGS